MNTSDRNQKKKILIVDDDEGILDAISLILEDTGYTVTTISDGNKTVKTVNEFQPDIILLDVLLSGNDGRDICKNLKDTPSLQQIPVIMISAHPTAKASIKRYHADAFLAKPFEAADLINVIEKYLKKYEES